MKYRNNIDQIGKIFWKFCTLVDVRICSLCWIYISHFYRICRCYLGHLWKFPFFLVPHYSLFLQCLFVNPLAIPCAGLFPLFASKRSKNKCKTKEKHVETATNYEQIFSPLNVVRGNHLPVEIYNIWDLPMFKLWAEVYQALLSWFWK